MDECRLHLYQKSSNITFDWNLNNLITNNYEPVTGYSTMGRNLLQNVHFLRNSLPEFMRYEDKSECVHST